MQLYKSGDQEKIEYNTNFTLSHTTEHPAKLGREGGKFSVQATLSKLSFVAHGKKNRRNYNGNLRAWRLACDWPNGKRDVVCTWKEMTFERYSQSFVQIVCHAVWYILVVALI